MPHATYQIREADLPYLILLDQFLSNNYILASFYELIIKNSTSSKSDREEITTKELTFFIIIEFLYFFKKELYQSPDVREGYSLLNAKEEHYKKINRKICNSITSSKYIECCKRIDDVPHYRWISIASDKSQEFQAYFESALDGKKRIIQQLLANQDLFIQRITAAISKQESKQQKGTIFPPLLFRPIAPKPARYVQDDLPAITFFPFRSSVRSKLPKRRNIADKRNITKWKFHSFTKPSKDSGATKVLQVKNLDFKDKMEQQVSPVERIRIKNLLN